MTVWTVRIHPAAEPELLALPADMQARFLRIAELLEGFGPQQVGMPHVRTLIVLHVFVKKTQTTPRAALETARTRLEAMR